MMTRRRAEKWASDPRCGLGSACFAPCNPPDYPEIGACEWCVLVETFDEAIIEAEKAGREDAVSLCKKVIDEHRETIVVIGAVKCIEKIEDLIKGIW